ncbi:MAG TPA: class I SAM-dependent methyltransferase [Paucimonas sp.]|nr:class I SAM-dependent methyltransferase [Paucimonas sp.]
MEQLLQNADNEEFLKHCYRRLLSREPDDGGLRHHLQAMAEGRTREEIVRIFVTSEEFLNGFNRPAQQAASQSDSVFQRFAPEGHFYSPIPAAEDYTAGYDAGVLDVLDAEAANERRQLELAETFRSLYAEMPFPMEPAEGFRYHLNNGRFNYFDGIILYSFIRMLKPKRIVEVGSGFSSAVMIDTCERFLGGQTDITFIEPYTETLYGRLRPEDKTRYTVIEKKVQDVPLEVFRSLEANDILFIDSSHVAKFGSDVNHLLFKVLPQLRDGVTIHFHDIFRHFDYPREWLTEGRAWNEGYLVRAFLACNKQFTIEFFNDWFAHRHWDYLERHLPLCTVQPEGSPFRNCGVSLWVRKNAA